MGSVQSARGAQPGRRRAARGDAVRRLPVSGVRRAPPRSAARARAPSLRGGAPRPAPDRSGAAPGEGTPSARAGFTAPGRRGRARPTPAARPRAPARRPAATRAVTRTRGRGREHPVRRAARSARRQGSAANFGHPPDPS